MSDFSENMEVSPTRQAQVAACEKLKDTITGKESTEEFIFPKKTDRPVSPASTQDPNFSDLEQDVEHPLPTTNQLTTNLQSKITSIADIYCIPIGPSLLKSRPPLQAQVTNTKNITVPDRGLKAAGAA
ncbi:hypothetical protein TNCV_756541 [Trichonephila clavipes]|nr:hypothetical protein TNCV_756541 [Trichonephila clavipes]